MVTGKGAAPLISPWLRTFNLRQGIFEASDDPGMSALWADWLFAVDVPPPQDPFRLWAANLIDRRPESVVDSGVYMRSLALLDSGPSPGEEAGAICLLGAGC